MNYVVAVSGGVDSAVLLDMLVKAGKDTIVVAHFDHGIRRHSAADARFVAGLAERYGLGFETERAELGQNASEQQARQYRYAFLRRVATKYDATIVTAHHRDDLIETIAINLTRGTGWRGLAVLNNPSIDRPLLTYTKKDLYGYALEHTLEWVEDETNASDTYLRNRLRRRLASLPSQSKDTLVTLCSEQCRLASDINRESGRFLPSSRYFLTMIDDSCATELLRAWLDTYSLSLTRPQRERLLYAVKTARPGDMFQAGNRVNVIFSRRDFIVKHPL